MHHAPRGTRESAARGRAMSEHYVTRLLEKINAGEKQHLDAIYAFLYKEIKAIAGNQISRLNTGQTITPTVLAHECYLKLSASEKLNLENSRHFMRCLSKSMRQYLIDTLRAKNADKRQHLLIDTGVSQYIGEQDIDFKLMEIEKALNVIEEINPDLSELLEYKLIFNLTFNEISQIIGKSERQVMRIWSQSKALLTAIMHDGHPESNHEQS